MLAPISCTLLIFLLAVRPSVRVLSQTLPEFETFNRKAKLISFLSYALIAVVRKSSEVPELREAVLSGRVSLSKAKKICSVITPKNHMQWIDLAATQTSRVIEKCVAQANPKEAVIE